VTNAATGGRARRKIAILGGGQAALTAAFQLTDPANPRSRDLEVTVYQIGWRLGGKGATGRPVDKPWAAYRIEEHGLHNWFGFYDNSFRQARACYGELARPAGAQFATFEEAFEGVNACVYVERVAGERRLWPIENMSNDAEPGKGGLFLSPWEYAVMALELLERVLRGSDFASLGRGDPLLEDVHASVTQRAQASGVDLEGASAASAIELLRTGQHLARRAHQSQGPTHRLVGLFSELASEVAAVESLVRRRDGPFSRAIGWVLHLFMQVLWDAVRGDVATPERDSARRTWIVANLVYACVVGAMRDGVIEHGFGVINDTDFRDWLEQHCFPDGGILRDSALVEAVYAASFAYRSGDARVPEAAAYPPRGEIEAGTALYGLVRAAFTYKGAFAYRFRAGTADTCYAPMWEVLRRRGVRFRFFHRVKHLRLDGTRIAAIVIGRQAELAGGEEYEPLVDVDGLLCWPSRPRWEQLVDGDWLRSVGADFEAPFEAVRAREQELILQVGRDFDDVVLGISIAALPEICSELRAASRKWRDALRTVQTVRTQALQLWMTETAEDLGFPVPNRPIVTWLYDTDNPLNVWGDFSELIAGERWPPEGRPLQLAYFCSTLPDDGDDPAAPFPDQRAANARVHTNVLKLLGRGIGILLPGAVRDGDFDWRLLLDQRSSPGAGAGRLDAQYYRANVVPTERFVLSVRGSSAHRLAVHDAREFTNLFLAGDWTQCILNSGCMEAATISGMLCANALCDYPPLGDIVGVRRMHAGSGVRREGISSRLWRWLIQRAPKRSR
jgi:uncharacterized protein with NAD-binding domain and iron-sulfur cluster